MNMENSEKIPTIETVNQKNAEEYTPAIVIMTLIVILGLTGNALAAIFYIRKAQKSVIHIFMSCLSVNDAVTNAILIKDIVQLFLYLSQDKIITCTLFYVLKHWLVGNSLFLMAAIAVDRYRRVCFPFAKQITYKVARYIILGLTFFSFLVASRNIATVDIFKFNITAESNSTITGYYCSQSKKHDLAQIKTIFHVVDICIHGIIMCSFVVVNILLLRTIIQTQQKLKRHGTFVSFKNHKSLDEKSAEKTKTDIVNIDFDRDNDTDQETRKSSEKKHGSINSKTNELVQCEKHKSSTLKRTNGTLRRFSSHTHAAWIEIKITTMVVVITIISAMCFIPYYVAMLTVKPDFSGSIQIMSVSEILARRSFMLNSAVNPFIMVAFNTPFRHFVFSVICRFCNKYHC